MAKGVNKIILLGRVGKMDSINNGVKFSVATNDKYKDKAGNFVETTEWHNCVAFGKIAEIVLQYVKVGSQLYLEGSLKGSQYQKDDGSTGYGISIFVKEVTLLGEKKPSNGNVAVPEEYKRSHSKPMPKKDDFYDDDIPF